MPTILVILMVLIVAFSTTLVTFKVRMTGQPAYLAKRLTTKEATHITRHNQQDIKVNFNLSTVGGGTGHHILKCSNIKSFLWKLTYCQYKNIKKIMILYKN